jgi:hypothetical protein
MLLGAVEGAGTEVRLPSSRGTDRGLHQLKPAFDLLNSSSRIATAIKDRLDEAREGGSAAKMYEQLVAGQTKDETDE